jgi:putative ABC transport system permease protein
VLKNFIKTAIRNILRNKFISFLNLSCLVIGMTSFFILMNYFAFENSYDTMHENGRQLYRLSTEIRGKSNEIQDKFSTIPCAVSPALKEVFPEIVDYVRIRIPGPNSGRNLVSYGEKQFFEDETAFVDSTFFQVFSFPLIEGDAKTVLAQPNSVVLSETYVKKYFGNKNPINEVLLFKSKQNRYSCKVTGVFKDMPPNSHLSLDMIISMSTYFPVYNKEWQRQDWALHDFYGFLLLKPQASYKALQAKFPAYLKERNPFDKQQESVDFHFVLQPMDAIHLDTAPDVKWDYAKVGSRLTVYFMFFIALVLLATAWINYTNLTTARALERAREVGVRKVLGSSRAQLMTQFFIESLILNLSALVISVVLSYVLIRVYGEYTENRIPLMLFSKVQYCLILLVLFIGCIGLSSWYPSFFISSFEPSSVAKSSGAPASSKLLRKSLVVVQFVCTSIFIICTFIALYQVKFLNEQSLGFNMDQMLVIEEPMSVKDSLYYRNVAQFVNDVENNTTLEKVATSTDVPGLEIGWADIFSMDNNTEKRYTIADGWVNYNFFDVYGMKFLAGRNFSKNFPTDIEAAIVNRSALQLLNIKTPEEALNHTLTQTVGNKFRIIGVIEDYHQESPIKEYVPTIFFLDIKERMSHLSVKLNKATFERDLNQVKDTWKKFFPDIPMNYFFLDDYYKRQYVEDRSFSKSLGLFSIVTVIIASLGLLGISYSNILDQTKEIAIRKVIGASNPSLLMHLLKDFLRMILIANVIAWPIAYLVMDRWLNNYATRAPMSIWIFLGSGALILGISLLVVGYQTFRAVTQNPIKALRSQ